jgi:hypothetical protein
MTPKLLLINKISCHVSETRMRITQLRNIQQRIGIHHPMNPIAFRVLSGEADVPSEGCSYDENAEAIADGTAFNVEGSEMLRFSSVFGEEYKREEMLTHHCQGTRHC